MFLKVENLTKRFGGLVAVDNFSMEITRRQITGLIGPNGAGKTTVLNMLSGLYRPDGGSIVFEDREISGKRPFEIARMGIGRTFQNIRLFNELNVLENVKIAHGWRSRDNLLLTMVGGTRVSRAEEEITRKAEECLERLDLLRLKNEYPGNLPYGTQRRVEIARALGSDPKLLLLDEPAAGLNPNEVQELMATLRKLVEDLDISIVLIEHRMEIVLNLCEWIFVLDFGKKIAEGTPKQIRENPAVIAAYLGEESRDA